MRKRSSLSQSILSAALLVGMTAMWIVLAPIQFGGQSSYVIIAGASMEPALHWGDLVIARQSRSYEIGDIIAYTHPRIGPVIHRIIEKEGLSYRLQGDNNDWVDSYQPTTDEIIGKSWITMPGLANILQHVRTPIGLALLSFVFGFMVLVTLSQSKDREGAWYKSTRQKKGLAPLKNLSEIRDGWTFPLTAFLLGGVLLGYFAFTTPLVDTITVEIPFQHRGKFSYYGDAPPSVYDQGRIESGDAIFHSIVSEFRTSFDYQFSAPALTEISGEYQISMEISEPNGWRRQIVLVPPTDFNGDDLRLTTRIDINRILWLIGHLQNRTEFKRSVYDVRILPVVNIEAEVSGHAIQDQFSPILHFKLDDFQLYLDGTNPVEETGDPFSPTQIGMIEQTKQIPATLHILGIDIKTETARWIAGSITFVSLLGLILIFVPIMQSWNQGRSSQIALQYSDILLDVDKLPKSTAAQTFTVSSFSDLARLAHSMSLLVLHQSKGNEHTYLLKSEDSAYRFTLQDESPEIET
ncbi:MAG: signal peptidase I [Anaerolineales bacterium]|nr:MAG: signal peptidase I [Anaerolineales bacterium]